ncbi:hypothetical protein GGX14DRAFT_373172 [Mycena pura]|uniref:Glycosyltransferase 61 catalytic domain-containing protein n=1 Tax=Mycena pura TaxID=153505 RepID=A0AAD6V311_9AGAR|nr:hypothetical protein GGX14DRAFT_373172 [Mycena pura]
MARTQYFSFGSRNARIILLLTVIVLAVINIPSSLFGYHYHCTWLQSRADSISPPPPKPTLTPAPWADGWTLTTIPIGTHVPGFTLLDHLYLRNGTFYIVTSDRASFPPREDLLSRPVETVSGDWVDTGPTDEASQLQFIAPRDASRILAILSGLLSTETQYMENFSVIVYDPPDLMTDYYHWFGEVIFGAWRVYSHISPDAPDMWTIPPKHLPLPRRFILPFMDRGKLAGTHGALMQLAFPHATIERSDYWDDLKKIDTTVVFDRVMLVNRHAATRSPSGGVPWSSSIIAGAMKVTSPPDFWAAVRSTLWRGILYYKYVPDMKLSPKDVDEYFPTCTYISRQEGFDRRLSAADHDGLIAALRELHAERVCDVRVVVLERMTLREQIHLAARTTVLLGVHGSGLNRSLRRTVYLGRTCRNSIGPLISGAGYSFDNELLTRNMGKRHYAVWNDTFVTYEKGSHHPIANFSDGFDGIIPVHGPTVVSIIRGRLPKPPTSWSRTIPPGTAWYEGWNLWR